ncbi:MAG: peptidoglycan-binding protein [Candidatus Omnitrophica bacterium]|nr:peptidoglycan-binding protein [Candidatus Omnitrophota bacterium]
MQVSPYNASMTAPMDSSSLELTSAPVTDKPTNKDIQQALKNAGTYNGPIDGSIGPKTKKAIRDFQVQTGLNADGKVGPRTWKKLSSHLNAVSVESAEPMTISN